MSLNIKLLLMIGSCFQLKHNYTCLIILLKYLIKIFNKNKTTTLKSKLQHRIGHQHQFKANTRTRKCIFKSIAPKKGTIGIKNIVFNFAGFYIPPI